MYSLGSTCKLLDQMIQELEEKREKLQKQLERVDKQIANAKLEKRRLNNIVSAKIKISDLKKTLTGISGQEITNVRINVIKAFYDVKNKKASEEQMNYLGNELYIVFEDKKIIWKYINLHLFNKLDEIQADGKTLEEHCIENPGTGALVINKNIDDIICKFKLNEISYDREGLQTDNLLEQAVFTCIDEGKALEIEKKDYQKIFR